jgi:hypothetical protein
VQPARESGQGMKVVIVIEPGQKKDIGRDLRDHPCGSEHVGCSIEDIAQKKAGTVTGQVDIVGRDAEGFGARLGADKAEDQTGCSSTSCSFSP